MLYLTQFLAQVNYCCAEYLWRIFPYAPVILFEYGILDI